MLSSQEAELDYRVQILSFGVGLPPSEIAGSAGVASSNVHGDPENRSRKAFVSKTPRTGRRVDSTSVPAVVARILGVPDFNHHHIPRLLLHVACLPIRYDITRLPTTSMYQDIDYSFAYTKPWVFCFSGVLQCRAAAPWVRDRRRRGFDGFLSAPTMHRPVESHPPLALLNSRRQPCITSRQSLCNCRPHGRCAHCSCR